jgi:hypothetical protein
VIADGSKLKRDRMEASCPAAQAADRRRQDPTSARPLTGWRPPSFHETIGPVGAAGWPNPVPTFLVETSVRGFSASKAPFCEYRAQVERLKLGD